MQLSKGFYYFKSSFKDDAHQHIPAIRERRMVNSSVPGLYNNCLEKFFKFGSKIHRLIFLRLFLQKKKKKHWRRHQRTCPCLHLYSLVSCLIFCLIRLMRFFCFLKTSGLRMYPFSLVSTPPVFISLQTHGLFMVKSWFGGSGQLISQ